MQQSQNIQRSPDYLPHIDVLRGVSVIIVVLFHAWPESLPGGFVGVDVFFVISGYLITKLLLEADERGEASYGQFLIRRVRRLWPSFATVLVATLFLGWVFLPPDRLIDLGEAAMAAVALVSNWYFFLNVDYFNEALNGNWLLHTWSLGVEEQFYLVFPLLVFLIGVRHRGRLVLALSVIWASSFGASVFTALEASGSQVFFATHLRIWEILSGALVYLTRLDHWALKLPRLARRLMGALALLIILGSAALISKDMAIPGYIIAVPVLGGVLYIISAHRPLTEEGLPQPPGRIRGAMAYTGRISYPLYLWHWPLLMGLSTVMRSPDDGPKLLIIAVAFVLSSLTYHFIEAPVRRKRIARTGPALIGTAGVTQGVCIACAAGFVLGAGLPSRIPQAAVDVLQQVPDPRLNSLGCAPASRVSQRLVGENLFGDLDPSYQLCPINLTSNQRPDRLIWGDSHLGAIMGALGERIDATGQSALIATRGACPPLLNGAWQALTPKDAEGCATFASGVTEMARRLRPQRTLLVGHWDIYAPSPANLLGQSRPGKLRLVGAAESGSSAQADTPLFEQLYHQTVETLRTVTKIEMLIDVPTQDFDVPSAVAFDLRHGWWPGPVWLSESQRQRQLSTYLDVFRASEAAGVVRLFDPTSLFCASGSCIGARDGVPLFLDSNHLNADGADFLLGGLPELAGPVAE